MNSNINTDLVVEALKEVMVPGTKVDIIKLNLVGEVKVTGGEVAVSVVKTTEKPETIDAIRQAVADKVSGLPGVMGVNGTTDPNPSAAGLTDTATIPLPTGPGCPGSSGSSPWPAPRVEWGNRRWR